MNFVTGSTYEQREWRCENDEIFYEFYVIRVKKAHDAIPRNCGCKISWSDDQNAIPWISYDTMRNEYKMNKRYENVTALYINESFSEEYFVKINETKIYLREGEFLDIQMGRYIFNEVI